MKQHVLESAKAYTALVVGIATALLGVYGPGTAVGQVLTVIVAIGGAIAVWKVPNAPEPYRPEPILGKAFTGGTFSKAAEDAHNGDPHRP